MDMSVSSSVDISVPLYAPDHIFVKYDPNLIRSLSAESAAEILKDFSDLVPGLQIIELPDGVTVEEAVDYYNALPGVLYAEPDYYVSTCSVPNDQYFNNLWGMKSGTGGIDAVSAWDKTTGSSNVIVAVLDTGVEISHPDLTNNLWVNTGEIWGNNIDDDHNGYIDDYYGWNFVDNTNDVTNYHAHGTHCAGIIGAVGNNNIGVSGVAWNVSIMSLRASYVSGSLPTSAIIEGIAYAKHQGADIVSCSFGSSYYSSAQYNAIANCPDMLFVCSAGNEGTNDPHYPSGFDLNNIISVAATDENGNLASFSTYGSTVDVAAPGVGIYSTVPTFTPKFTIFYLNQNTRNQYGIITDDHGPDVWGWNYIYDLNDEKLGDEGVFAIGNARSLIYLKNSISLVGEPSELLLDYYWNLYPSDKLDVVISNRAYDRYTTIAGLEADLLANRNVIVLKNKDELEDTSIDVSYVNKVLGTGPYYIGYLYRATETDSIAVLDCFAIDTHQKGENSYVYMSGTSMATPMVSGLAALIKSANPDLTNLEIKDIILTTVNPKQSLAGKVVTGGIVNASAAINMLPLVPTTIDLSNIARSVACHTTGVLGTPVVNDQYGTKIPGSPVTWSSNDSSILSFEGNVYTAKAEGPVLITVTAQNGVNGTISIVVKAPVPPKFTIDTSSPSVISKGDNITISGIAEGTDQLLYYVLAPHYSRGGYLFVENGTYSANFSTANLTVGSPCFVLIQHPMYDHFFNVIPIREKDTTFVYQNNTAQPSGGPSDIFLFNMTNTTGIYAYDHLTQAINDPANDDIHVNLTFSICAGDPAAGSVVYIYQNMALKSNTNYYRWVSGNQDGSVITNINGTVMGEGITEGLYSSSSTSPADLFTLKYPDIHLSGYLSSTSTLISDRNIPKNQTIDFNVSGDNGLLYALRFTSPVGGSTYTFGDRTFDLANISRDPSILDAVPLNNVALGRWEVIALFADSPDSDKTLNTYTPSVYKCSEIIKFNVCTAEPWLFTATPDSLNVQKGDEVVITGTAENTGGYLRYYAFTDNYTISRLFNINADGTYKINFSTEHFTADSCFVIIQHPMYDGIFNIAPVQIPSLNNRVYILQNNTAKPTGGNGDIFLVNTSNTSGFPAFEKVIKALDDTANDDRELNLTFRITGKTNDTTLPLNQGWNFISVPKTLNATKNTAGSLFGSVDTCDRSILGYSTQTQTWIPIREVNEIIQPLNGYWIFAAAGTDINLTYSSDPTLPSTKTLYPGWNAIGLSADEQTTADDALACLGDSWKTVIPWNLAAGMYDPAIINGSHGPNSPERFMTLGNGYWIYVDEQSTLIGLTA